MAIQPFEILLIGAAGPSTAHVPPATAADGVARFRKHDDVRFNITDDGLVILHIGRGEIYSGSPAAAQVWEMLVEQGLSVDEAVEKFSTDAADGSSKDDVRWQVMALVQFLKKNEILLEK